MAREGPRRGLDRWLAAVAGWRPRPGLEHALALGVLAYVAFWLVAYARRDGDFPLYLAGGNAVLTATDIYRTGAYGSTGWPPVFVLGCVPLALLDRISPPLARGTWVALNAVLLFACLRMLAAMVWRRPLTPMPRPGGLSLGSPEILLPLVLTGRFLHDNFEYLQVNVAILALTLAGLLWIGRNRDVRGGIALGAAAALKVLPAAFIPFLAWRGRWRAAGWAMASVAFWTLLVPTVAFGPHRHLEYLRNFPAAVREGRGVNGPNQSLYAMAERTVGMGVRPWNALATPTAYLAPTGNRAAVAAAAAACLAVVAVCALVFRGAPWRPDAAGLLEVAAVMTATVLLSPCSWIHYFVALLVPCAVLWGRWRQGPPGPGGSRVAAAGLAAVIALTMFTSRAVIGTRLANAALALSCVTLATITLFIAAVRLRRTAAAVRER